MTVNPRTLAPTALLGVAALALSACGGSDTTEAVEAVEVGTRAAVDTTTATPDDPAAPEDSAPTDDSATPDDAASTATGDAASTATGDAGAAGPPRPERDRCVEVPEVADGVYPVYEAGTATVTAADGRLTVVDVQAADGWASRVDDQDGDEVEIDFRRDGATDVLDLEVEVDDGRVEVRICNDDD